MCRKQGNARPRRRRKIKPKWMYLQIFCCCYIKRSISKRNCSNSSSSSVFVNNIGFFSFSAYSSCIIFSWKQLFAFLWMAFFHSLMFSWLLVEHNLREKRGGKFFFRAFDAALLSFWGMTNQSSPSEGTSKNEPRSNNVLRVFILLIAPALALEPEKWTTAQGTRMKSDGLLIRFGSGMRR